MTKSKSVLEATIAKYREAAQILTEKREALNQVLGPFATLARDATLKDLALAKASVEEIEAAAKAYAAGHATARDIDRVEVEAGDEITVARDPQCVCNDLAGFEDERVKLREALADVDRRHDERVAAALAADAAYIARRAAANLPASPPIPRSTDPKVFSRFIESSKVPTRDFTTPIKNARERRVAVAATLEERRLAAEQEKKDAQAQREAKAREQERRAAALAAENRAAREGTNAAQARREKLAGDYLGRHS